MFQLKGNTSLLLLFILLTIHSVSCYSRMNDTTIRFGVSLSTVPPFSSQRTVFGARTLKAFEYALKTFNEKGGVVVDGIQYDFDLIWMEDEGNSTAMVQNYQRMINENEVDFFFGPVASDFSAIGSSVTSPDYIMLGTNAGSPLFYQKEKCAGIATAAELQFDSALPELRLAGAQTVVVIKSGNPVMDDACSSVAQKVPEQGMKLIGSYDVEISLSGMTEDIQKNISDTIKLISENYQSVDALLMCVFPPGGYQVMASLKEYNYNPGSIISAVFPGAWDGFDAEVINYVSGFATFNENASFVGDIFGSTSDFRTGYMTEYPNDEPDDLTVFGSVAAIVYKTAIENAQSFDQDQVYSQILSLDLDTYIGKYRFSGDHAQQHSFIFVQWVDGVRRIISPVQIKETSLVYPFPRWDEREISTDLATQEIVFMIITVAAILFCVAFIVFVCANQDTDAIRASTPFFLYIIAIGGMVVLSSNFFWIPQLQTSLPVCHLRYWTLCLGFAIMFGCLFGKTWRIAKLFDFSSFEVFSVTEGHVMVLVGVLVLIQVVLLLLYSIFSGVSSELVIVDADRYAYNYYECKETSGIFLYIMGGFALALLLFGTVLGIVIHNNVSDSRYNESKIIGFMIYNIFFFFVVIVAVHFADIERYFLFSLRSAGITISTLITLLAIGINRYSLIKNPPGTTRSQPNSGTGNNTGGQSARIYSQHSQTNDQTQKKDREIRGLTRKLEKALGELERYHSKFGSLQESSTGTEQTVELSVDPSSSS
eukprot:TRINITY_DN5153_c0_g1_i1.p1 TRINITY_DN5153_c0_g1~~TRINITY_DN5153_c0_g1_i1.p1  ORF type:complete len:777 (+),score=151.85 TRINITY_DN5153_c0_g1_i1:38-2332(+)